MLWEYVNIGNEMVRSSMAGLCLMIGSSLTSSTKESRGNTSLSVAALLRSFRSRRKTRSGSPKKKDKRKGTPEHEKTQGLGALLALEPRIMFDGAALITGAEVVQDQITQDLPTLDQEPRASDSGDKTFSDPFTDSLDLIAALSTATAPSDRNEIVFIDTRVEDYQTLLLGIDPNVEAVLLDSARDGIEQIAEILRDRTDIDAIHLIAEGNAAELHLGTTFLTQESITGKYASLFTQIGQSLSADADFLIYGCNFGEGEVGLEAMETLAELTGADIAASTDRTGHVSEYGNWELEVATGTIETSIVIGEATQAAWEGVLATYTVTTTTDGGAGSLRQAIIDANANGGTDTITFVGSGTYLLTITGAGEDAAATGDLDITDDLILTGNGAGNTVIDASGFGGTPDRVFQIKGTNITATMSGITIQGGDQSNSGGIFVDNTTTLNLSAATITGNTTTGGPGANGTGGGMHVHGTANITNVLISGNTANIGGGGISFHNTGTGSLTNVTISGNTSAGVGGGLWTDAPITVTNSTVTLNNASDAGGIYQSVSAVTLSNTIVSGNTATGSDKDVQGTFSSNNFNLIEVVGTATGFGSDITGVSANLGGLADNGGPTMTHALLGGSLAINAGTTTGAPSFDQRGLARDASFDIGAFEFGATSSGLIVDTTNDLTDGDTSSVSALLGNKGGDGFISLREAIIATNNSAGTDTITFLGSGTYLLTDTGTSEDAAATGDLDITDDLILIGNGAGNTVIDGGTNDRIFEVFSGATADLSGVTIQNGGGVSDGAGIHNKGNLTLTNSAITGNSASNWGGGLYNSSSGNLTFLGVTISGNDAIDGGGINIFSTGGTLLFTNVTISGNTASGNGGGLFTRQTLNLTNSTIASNLGGGGIHEQAAGDAILKNTILDNNVGGNANRALTSAGNNIDSDSTAGLLDPLDGQDPMLGALADNGGPTLTHALLAGSVAINAGTAAGTPTIDQRGFSRLGATDIGAFEFGASAGTFQVDTTNDVVDGDTSSVSALVSNKGADGFISLREAIIAVNAGTGGETILLQSGTYTLSIAGTGEDAALTGDLDIQKDVTITGVSAGTTIVDANGIDRAFEVDSGASATMSDLTIRGGDAATTLSDGGGLLVSGGATLTNVILTGNTAEDGGGIQNRGTLDLTDVTIDNNTSTGSGAGIDSRGTTTLTRTTVSNNTNTGSNGGGIHVQNGSLAATNVTISGNSTVNEGGGIYANNPVTLQNVTITNNSAASASGVEAKPGGPVTLRNTIIAGNTGSADIDGGFTTQNNNLIGDMGTATGLVNGVNGDQVGTGGSPIDAMLGALADNGGPTQTHALLAGSPAIDAGTTTGAPTSDQRGFGRNGTPDIGAFESSPVNLAPVNVVPVAQTTNQDTTLVFSSGTSNQISISDPDAGGSDVQVTLTTTNGTVTLAGTTGLTFSIGDGTADATMTFSGTVAAINTALNGLMFDPTTSYTGPASVEITTNDQGSTGAALLDGDANITTKYTFDVDGTDAIGANDATLNNGAAIVADAERGNVLSTDGINDYADVPAVVTNGLSQFTFSFWVKTTESGTNATYYNRPTLFGMEVAGFGNNDLAINTNNGFIGFWTGLSGAGDGNYLSTTTQINDNQWHQITVSNDGANASLYVDGVLETSLATGNGLAIPAFFIGALNNSAVPGRYHSGSFDDVRIFNRSLTTQEANDLYGLSDTDTVAVTVNATPVNTVPGAQVVDEYTATGISGLSVNDVDGNLSTVQLGVTQGTVTVTLSGGASISAGGNGTTTLTLSGTQADINATLASLSYQSNLNYSGPDTLTMTSTDSNSATDVDPVSITVTAVNNQPTFTGLDNAPTFTEGGAAVVFDNNATIADPELDAANNYNGATLTLARNGGANADDLFNGTGTLLPLVESGPLVVGITNIGTVTTNTGGTLVLTFNGNATTALVNSALQQITYANSSVTPPANVQIDYTIDDGNAGGQGSGPALNDMGSITVSITSLNTPPVAVADGFTVNEGSTNTLNLAGNDLDIDDGLDLTSITIVAGPTNGTIDSINAGGTVTYTHNGSETLSDSFTYTINDLAGSTSNTVTVSLIITPQNDPPIITSDGGGASASISILTGNTAVTDVDATDAEGIPLTYSITGGADGALFSIDPTTGVLTFQTAPNVQAPRDVGGNNIYDVIVQASDGALTDTQAIAITVADVPFVVLPPTADPPAESPSDNGDEDAGESENNVSGNVLNAGSHSHGNGSNDNHNSTGDESKDSNLWNHLAKDNVALMQQLKEANGINGGTVRDLMDWLQTSFGTTTSTSEMESLLGTSSGFLKDLDQARDALNDMVTTEKTYVASSIAASTGLSVGYVFWLLRSGVLLTALLSSVPAWQFVNPLLVLDSPTKKKGQKDQEDLEDDSVESMFENHTGPNETSDKKAEDMPQDNQSRSTRSTSP